MQGLVNISKARQLLSSASLNDAFDLRNKAAAVQDFFKAQKESYETYSEAARVKLMCERRLGELLAAMEKQHGARGVGKKVESHDVTPLSDLGISKMQSSRWQQAAKVDDAKFEEWVAATIEKKGDITQAGLLRLAKGSSVAALANTGEIEWYTPQKYIALARKVMGGIDVDPASSAIANETVKATKYFTQDHDGLSEKWVGRVWMNPPYATGMVNEFAEKLCEEIDAENVKQAIVLVNNATDTRWFHELMNYASAICGKLGRIAFINQEGDEVKGAAQGQVFIYFGDSQKKFCEVFGEIGWVAEVCSE